MGIYIYLALLFSMFGLAFSFWRLVSTLRGQDEEFFYWGGGIYFASIPILFDSVMMAVGELKALNDSILSENPSYWAGVDSFDLMNAALFVLLFNFVYWLSGQAACRFIKIKASRCISSFGAVGTFFLLFVVYSSLALALSEGVDFIQKQKDDIQTTFFGTLAQLIIPISAVCLYIYSKERRYVLSGLFALPLVLVSFVGQARAMFFYIPAAFVLLHIVKNQGNVKLGRLGVYLVALLCLSVAVKVVANEDHGFWYADNKALFFASNVLRDVSVGDFYFSIHTREYSEHLTTQGKSSLALFLTGIVPPFLGKEVFDSDNTVIMRIYQLRFGDYSFGSVHPTFYGCAYFDLGYFGLVLAVFFPVVLRVFKKIYGGKFFSQAMVVLIAGFWFVAMRGSPNVAYFRLFYSSLLILVILNVAYSLDRAYKFSRGVP